MLQLLCPEPGPPERPVRRIGGGTEPVENDNWQFYAQGMVSLLTPWL